jgi:flavin-dependent dehydrogenase
LIAWNRLSLDNLESEAEWVPRVLPGHKRKGKTRAADVTWRMVTAAAGPGYLLVGDAASVLDPASSHGVLKALMTGMMAADIIVSRARGEVRERESAIAYNAWIRNWFVHDTKKLKDLYSVFPSCREWPLANVKSVS